MVYTRLEVATAAASILSANLAVGASLAGAPHRSEVPAAAVLRPPNAPVIQVRPTPAMGMLEPEPARVREQGGQQSAGAAAARARVGWGERTRDRDCSIQFGRISSFGSIDRTETRAFLSGRLFFNGTV